MGDSSNKKVVVAGVASILLVAAVVAVVVGNNHGGAAKPTAGSTKAVQAVCSSTHYKDTCEKSLAHANTTEPRELIKVAFDAAAQSISEVVQNSQLLKEAEADQSTKDSYRICKEVLETAVEDLQRSIEKVGVVDVARTNEYLLDMKVWLSSVITMQETCIDAYNETNSEAGEKMRQMLTTARQLSSNGLAMVKDISSLIGSLQFGSSRKLMSEEPAFAKRRLLEATKMDMQPDIVVAQDGSGNFTTINAAIETLQEKSNKSVVIYIKKGVYKEYVTIPKHVNNITLIGDGPLNTIVTGNKNFADGVKTYDTATVAVNGNEFFAKDIAFENTAGAKGHQAVALRASGDTAVFYNVHINGYQDSLYAHANRQYYKNCTISGTIDFVFGDARALFQDCIFIVRKPDPNQSCMVTAQGRVEEDSEGAFVIQNGTITAEPAFLEAQPPFHAFLGRPWKLLSRTIIMQSNIEGFIDPAHWSPWLGDFAKNTCYYAEWGNRGDGSSIENRPKDWEGIVKNMTAQMAESWTGAVMYGTDDKWIKETGTPYVPTMMDIPTNN